MFGEHPPLLIKEPSLQHARRVSLLAASTFWDGAQAYATAMLGDAVVISSLTITRPRLSTVLYLVGRLSRS